MILVAKLFLNENDNIHKSKAQEIRLLNEY